MSEARAADFTWREIGTRIRDWRLARGWSQQQLAEAAGISQSGVVHLEKGDTNPQLNTLQEVAAAFGKSLRELMIGSAGDSQPGSQLDVRYRRVVESNDSGALTALTCGLQLAEMLLDRRFGGSTGTLSEETAGMSASTTRGRKRGRD